MNQNFELQLIKNQSNSKGETLRIKLLKIMKHDLHSLQKISSPDKIGYVGMLVVVNLQIAGKISRIPWGIPGDCGCWWRESTREFWL